MEIYYVSKNKDKIKEVNEILGKDIKVIPYKKTIEELQSEDLELIVKDKVRKAFSMIKRPTFVEHTVLEIEDINGFPGGLTEIFWNKLKADKICKYFGGSRVKAVSKIAYCDTRKIYIFRGEIEGKIAWKPAGDREFQWDCVFVPNKIKKDNKLEENKRNKTFAEIEKGKNEISMRMQSLEKLKEHLENNKEAYYGGKTT